MALYDQLLNVADTPVVRLNRAVAVGERDGWQAGLAALAGLDADALDGYAPYHAARAELLVRAGHSTEAAAAYAQAMDSTADVALRRHLERRRRAALT